MQARPATFAFLLTLKFSMVTLQSAGFSSDPATTTAEIGKCLVEGRADILLVTSDELSDAWRKFAVWKTKSGRPTKVVTVSEIEKKIEGDDIQAKIRQCCLSHIEFQNTKSVVLGGDSRGQRGGPSG